MPYARGPAQAAGAKVKAVKVRERRMVDRVDGNVLLAMASWSLGMGFCSLAVALDAL